MLHIRKIKQMHPVFDITVENNGNFFANNMLVHNCAEISLPTVPLNDINDCKPVKKNIKMTKADYEKYLIWRKNNPNTLLPNS